MDAVHLHLVLTHVPIVGAFFVAVTFLWAALKKDRSVGWFALYSSVAVSLAAIPAYLAGMAAEERVEHLRWANESLIDTHETIATIALILSVLISIVSIVIIIINRKSDHIKPVLFWGMSLIVFLQFAILSFTGNRGGLIGHPEIRGNIDSYKGYTEKYYYNYGKEKYLGEDD